MKNAISTLWCFLFVMSFGYSQNSSLDFDHTDDNIEIESSPQFTSNQFTIEAWVQSKATDTGQPIFTKYNSNNQEITYALLVQSDGKIRFVVYQRPNPSVILRGIDTNNPVIDPGKWHHVAATFNLSTQEIKIYIDGVESASTLLSSSTNLTSIFEANQPVHIGKIIFLDGNAQYFNGKIDEVRFWNQERTQSEISSNKDTELTGLETGLVAYYKMDNPNSSCDSEDCSINDFHGIRNGPIGNNNLPQYSTDTPLLTDVSCGVPNSCTSLPVELTEFRGDILNKQVELKWATSLELNNAGFEVQKSSDGVNWQIIGFVASQNYTNKYTYNDSDLPVGISYYRLKQIDFDGAFELSKVVSVEYDNSNNNIQAYPNPSSGKTSIEVKNLLAEKMKVKVNDSMGRTIWESALIQGETHWQKEFQLSKSGIYFVNVQIGNNVSVKRVAITN